eukprot:TRINITY_DN34693_c0_g1_i1.p1 TRINITY_DN34693_c0_g1~~TRINITY_DN34693_c0_g1_i1.p1  ORF type:complete len:488 (-),score=166.45 TRINITY_DN34693_c0_g1_i1:21-1484(-)
MAPEPTVQSGPGGAPAAPTSEEAWKKVFDADAAELTRSERTQQQFQAVLQTLQKKADELEAENQRLRIQVFGEEDPCASLHDEVARGREALRKVEAEQQQVDSEVAKARESANLIREETARLQAQAREAEAATERLAAERELSEAQCERALAEARTRVSTDALHRVREEAERTKQQLEEQEVETAKLRQALAEAWAARAEGGTQQPDAGPGAEDLDRMQEELEWLFKLQQEAAEEARLLGKLERSEAALQAELREASEQKAALQSARVDLSDVGSAMREAMAQQSEGYVKKIAELESARKVTDGDRVKLAQELAGLQEQLEAMRPELSSLVALEERHSSMHKQKKSLADEGERLRVVNGALGVMLLGDDAPPLAPTVGADHSQNGADAGAAAAMITQVLQLEGRLVERLEAHSVERHKLADRIRQLEREAAQPGTSMDAAPATINIRDLKGSRPAPSIEPPSALSAATSALKGGLGKLSALGLPPRA